MNKAKKYLNGYVIEYNKYGEPKFRKGPSSDANSYFTFEDLLTDFAEKYLRGFADEWNQKIDRSTILEIDIEKFKDNEQI